MLCPFLCSCISKLSYLLHDIFLKGKKTSTYPVCWVRWLRELFLSTVAGVCVKLQEHRRIGFRGPELGSDGQVTEKEIWEGCLRSSDRGRQEPDVFAGLEPWAVEEGVEETWGSGVKLGRKWQKTCATLRLGLPQGQGRLTVCAGGIARDHCSKWGLRGPQ